MCEPTKRLQLSLFERFNLIVTRLKAVLVRMGASILGIVCAVSASCFMSRKCLQTKILGKKQLGR